MAIIVRTFDNGNHTMNGVTVTEILAVLFSLLLLCAQGMLVFCSPCVRLSASAGADCLDVDACDLCECVNHYVDCESRGLVLLPCSFPNGTTEIYALFNSISRLSKQSFDSLAELEYLLVIQSVYH
jgi:hypothetical protein